MLRQLAHCAHLPVEGESECPADGRAPVCPNAYTDGSVVLVHRYRVIILRTHPWHG